MSSILSTIKTILTSTGGMSIILGLIGFFLVFGLIAWVGWYFFKKKYVFKYKFLVINALGNMNVKKGRITVNKQKVEVFELEGLTDKYLEIKEPNMYYNGSPMRVVAYDGMGQIAWCDKLKFDKEQYLKVALTPPERQMSAQTAIEAGQKYGRMPTEYKVAIGFSIAVIFIMVIGMYAVGKLTVEITEQASISATNMIKVADKQTGMINAVERHGLAMENLLKYLSKDQNITYLYETD